MPLNPLAFDSQEEFETALMKNGLLRGWVPFLTNPDQVIHSILEHHGIKGMRWGHRKEVHPDIADVPRKTRKEASKDAEEFTKAKLFFGQGAGVRRRLIKAKVEAKKAKDPLYSKAFDHFVKQTDLGKRASQARKERRRKDTSASVKKTAKGVGHITRGNPQYSNTAAQVGVGLGKVLLKNLKQSDLEDGEYILEHHGIKGMRWGHRKEGPSGPQGVVVSRGRKKIKTSGGEGHPAHPDAVRARTAGQIAKKSGVGSLSNAELKAFNERLNLEQNYSRLTNQDKSAGRKFVNKQMSQGVEAGIKSGVKSGIKSKKVRKKIALGAAALVVKVVT